MIEVEKVVVRRKGSGTPEVLFPKQIFDAIWGKDDRIPVRIRFESKNRIVIERITDGHIDVDAVLEEVTTNA